MSGEYDMAVAELASALTEAATYGGQVRHGGADGETADRVAIMITNLKGAVRRFEAAHLKLEAAAGRPPGSPPHLHVMDEDRRTCRYCDGVLGQIGNRLTVGGYVTCPDWRPADG